MPSDHQVYSERAPSDLYFYRQDPGPCKLLDHEKLPNHFIKMDSLEEYMEKNAWPKIPLVQPGKTGVSGRKVLIVFILFNGNNLTAPVQRKHAEPAVVGMEAVRALGSRHDIEFGVIVPPGGSEGDLSKLAQMYDFHIFERKHATSFENIPANIKND